MCWIQLDCWIRDPAIAIPNWKTIVLKIYNLFHNNLLFFIWPGLISLDCCFFITVFYIVVLGLHTLQHFLPFVKVWITTVFFNLFLSNFPSFF